MYSIVPGQQSLKARSGSSDCLSNSFTSENGLVFDTYCGEDLVAHEIGNSIETSMTDCMNHCSTYRPICYGATFFTENGTCSFKAQNVTTADFNTSDSSDDFNSAIAYATQLQPLNTLCPYQNSSIIDTRGGLPFEILCNLDMAGYGDYYPDGQPYRAHTDTMIECMELCADSHPLCLGVSWNPDMLAGFGNCYLKNSQNGVNKADAGYTTHSGLVQLPVSNACSTSEPLQLLSNGKTFNVTCFEGRTGSNNFTSYYSANITACIDDCAAYTGQETCLGVFYDNSLKDGFENCYLLNTTGSANPGLNATYAEMVSTSSPVSAASSSLSGSHSGGSPSKAWIAAPVLVCFAALTLLLLGLYWWRRKSGIQQGARFKPFGTDPQPKTSPKFYELYSHPVLEMKASSPRHELAT